MTSKEKYEELVDLLEEVGIMQLDTEWAEQIQQMIEDHKEGRK